MRWEYAEYTTRYGATGHVAYTHRPVASSPDREDHMKALRRLGDEGWELVGFTANGQSFYYIFKRQLP